MTAVGMADPDGFRLGDALVTATLMNDSRAVFAMLAPATPEEMRGALLYLASSHAEYIEAAHGSDALAMWAASLAERGDV